MNSLPRATTDVDPRQGTNRPIGDTIPADLPGAHSDIDRFRQQRVNRLGHVCRECRNPDCVGDQRDKDEITFACAESSARMSGADYFACPGCGRDNRTIPGCQPAVA